MVMSRPVREIASVIVRRLTGATAVVPVLAAVGGIARAADQDQASVQNPLTVTLLGPVGLVAVALGVLGMTLGLLRMRRRTRETATMAPSHGRNATARGRVKATSN